MGMSTSWHSLYIRHAEPETVSAALIALLEQHGYVLYDPFPGGTGTPPGLVDLARLFIAPVQDGWVRVLGELPRALWPELSTALRMPVLIAWLDEESGRIVLAAEGRCREDPEAFAPFLREGATLDDLRQAWAGSAAVPEQTEPGQGLPPALRDLARQQGVDPRKAGNLFEQLSSSLFGRLAGQAGESSAEQEAARAVLMGGGRDPWDSLRGRRVRAIAGVLDLPANWRTPSWETVRDAYHALRMQQRYPRMMPLPGDRDSLAAVPDVAEYRAVFMGRVQSGEKHG